MQVVGRNMARLGKMALIIALAMGLTSAADSQSYSFPPAGRFILPTPLGKGLLQQCSRSAPTGVTEFWQPSTKEVDELESLLSKYLEQREKAGKSVPPKGSYHRQYVGFVTGARSVHPGERFIYANFYLDTTVPPNRGNESLQPMAVCDGGPAFWGIVYRVSTKSFEDPQFNGRG
jgi:hypothetical protein